MEIKNYTEEELKQWMEDNWEDKSPGKKRNIVIYCWGTEALKLIDKYIREEYARKYEEE
jgi:hypothetical protein